MPELLWKEYVWHFQTLKQLSQKYKRSKNWIRNHLQAYQKKRVKVLPQDVVLIADSTFFKRSFGLCVFRAVHLKKNLYWSEIVSETVQVYIDGKKIIEDQGFILKAIVLDGRPGIRDIFTDIPVQMCQFHQIMIINRYITRNPKLEASIELRQIVLTLCKSNEIDFNIKLNDWHLNWQLFLKEKTINPITKRWFYTHKRIRSAYRSLKRNMPFLFTYQKYPDLNIPNTTNSLDGSFSYLKGKVLIHRGLNKNIKMKIIDEYLAK